MNIFNQLYTVNSLDDFYSSLGKMSALYKSLARQGIQSYIDRFYVASTIYELDRSSWDKHYAMKMTDDMLAKSIEEQINAYKIEIHTYKYHGKNYVYFRVHCFATEIEEFIHHCVKYCELNDAPYWDYADKPNDVTEEEWNDRKNIVESAYSEKGVKSDIVKMVMDIPHSLDFIRNTPSKNQRFSILMMELLPYNGVNSFPYNVEYFDLMSNFLYQCDYSPFHALLEDIDINDFTSYMVNGKLPYKANSLTYEDVENVKNYVISKGKESHPELFNNKFYH